MIKTVLTTLILGFFSLAQGQANLYVSNSDNSNLLKWPIIECGSHIYYLTDRHDTLNNSFDIRQYYFSKVNKYTSVLVKSVLICSDTAFNVFEPFQVVNI